MNEKIQHFLASPIKRILISIAFTVLTAVSFLVLLNGSEFWLPIICAISQLVFHGLLSASRIESSWKSFGLNFDKTAIKQTGFGFLLAVIAMGLIIFVLWLNGGYLYYFGDKIDYIAFALSLTPLIFQAFYEELIFRGVAFQSIYESLGEKWAIFLSAAFFGLGHIFNPSANIISTLNISVAGALIAYLWTRSGSLIPCVSFHIFWNIIQGKALGSPVSGIYFGESIFEYDVLKVPTLLFGGDFGFEGGIIVSFILIVSFYFVYKFIPISKSNKENFLKRKIAENALKSA